MLYDLINIVSVASIVVLNIFKSSITVPFILGYSICDTLYILKNKTIHRPNRRVQLILHHLASIYFVLTTRSEYFKQYSYFGPRIINIDISTLLIMASKLTKIQVLHPISMIVWFYYRIVYFPRLLLEISHVVPVPVPLQVIMYLGLVWTLEGLKVPKNFLRPCNVSIVSSIIPVVYLSYSQEEYLVCIHSMLLITSSILHHSHWNIGDIFHRFDKFIVYTYVIHLILKYYDRLFFWKCFLGVIISHSESLKITRNHTSESRDWNNILELFPHMCVHFFTGFGIYYSIKST